MRVCIITPSFGADINGISISTGRLARGLHELGYIVEVFTAHHKRSGLSPTGILYSINDFGYSLSSELSIEQVMLRNHKIIVTCWQTSLTKKAFLIASMNHLKIILWSHCLSTRQWYSQHYLYSIFRRLRWSLYENWVQAHKHLVSDIVFLDRFGKVDRCTDISLFAGEESSHSWFIPNIISSLESDCRPFEERDIILSVGSYSWKKGFKEAIIAFYSSQLFSKFKLVLCGFSKSVYYHDCKRLILHLGIQDFVELRIGCLSNEITGLYNRSILNISCSTTECQPLGLIDGLPFGTPFIGPDKGFISSIRGGYIYRNNRLLPSLMKRAVLKVEWERLSKIALSEASRFSPSMVLSKWDELLGGEFN